MRSDILASLGIKLAEASENEGLAVQQMSQNWDGMEWHKVKGFSSQYPSYDYQCTHHKLRWNDIAQRKHIFYAVKVTSQSSNPEKSFRTMR